MADVISGVGTTFYRWDSGTGQWVRIAKVKSITGPSKTRAFIDVTSLDSTGGYREFITGFRDAGTIALALVFTRDGYEALDNDFASEALQNYMILLPDTDETSLEFEGLVTELPLTIPTDDAVTFDCTIKITGAVALASGSATGSA